MGSKAGYNFMNWKLRHKLLFSMLIVSIVPTIIATWIQYSEGSKYILAVEQKNLSLHAGVIQEQIDLYFENLKNHTLSLALNKEVVDFMKLEEKKLRDVERMNVLFDSMKKISDEEYSALFVLQPDGMCLACTDRRFIGTDYTFRFYYQYVINHQMPSFISDFCIGLRSLIPGVFISAPVRADDNTVVGVIVLKIAGDAIWKLVERLSAESRKAGRAREKIKVKREWMSVDENVSQQMPEISIVNRDGVIISHSNQKMVYKSLDNLSEEVTGKLQQNRQFLGRNIESLKNTVLKTLYDQAFRANKLISTTYFDKINNCWNVVAISPLRNNNWCVGVSISYHEFSILSQILLDKTIAYLSFITLGIIILALLISMIINRPMEYIISIIRRVERKDWTVRFDMQSKDEFGILGNEFNKLVSTIEEYSTTLEEKVKKRTAEIALLQQENVRLRIIEEKERICSELHDSLGARLTNIFICNNIAKSVMKQNNGKMGEMLQRIEENCQHAINDIKNIISGVREAGKDSIDYQKILALKIKNRLSLANVEFRHSITHSEGLNALNWKIKLEIEKILQELVTNVMKHADAETVVMNMNVENGFVHIDFKDDGKGFDQKEQTDGFGLITLFKRVEAMNGKIELITSKNTGTQFLIVIPKYTEISR